MTILKPGDKAPAFSLPVAPEETLSLASLKGKNVVLYFYPKDDTPGCTREACDFTENLGAFKKLDAVVIGVSKDSLKKHAAFAKKFNLTFPLGSDENGKVCEAYGVWIEKSMYGKKYMGIDRATFLIDGEGIIRSVWRGVKVPGHVDEVAKALKDIGKKAA